MNTEQLLLLDVNCLRTKQNIACCSAVDAVVELTGRKGKERKKEGLERKGKGGVGKE